MATVFYSWQSDCPNKTNRTFIQKAIRQAIAELDEELSLHEAERLDIDHDTKGLGGSPVIVDAIFKKIDACTIFVADLTFVGKSEKRLIPNPNVLIEYGWALKSRGNPRVLPIMNAAFGEPNETNLPFDLRNARWPFAYHLKEGADSETRIKELEKLVAYFKMAFLTIIKESGLDSGTVELFKSMATVNPATFLKEDESLGRFNAPYVSPTGDLKVGHDHLFYLRLFPKYPVEPFENALKASHAVMELRPLDEKPSGGSPGRNKHGGFFASHDNERIYSITQLMTTKELWGINFYLLDPNFPPRPSGSDKMIYMDEIKNAYLFTLRNYLQFYLQKLKIKPPFIAKMGLSGIEGFQYMKTGLDFRQYPNVSGYVHEDTVEYGFEITDEVFPSDKLELFFDKVTTAAGITPIRKRSKVFAS